MNLIFTLLKSIFNFQKYLVSGSLLVLLFITALSNNSWGYNNFIFNLQVSFSTTPSDDDNDGQILICEGATVLFTDTSTDVPPGAIYSWSFPGGSFTSADTPGPHNVTFDSAGSYIVSLDIDGVISELTVNVDESTEIEPEIAVDNWGQSMFNGVDYFTWCSTAQAGATFSFETTSTNTSPNSLHTLTTGSDLIASFTGENNPLIEYYFSDPGYYQINYVIQEGSCFFESNFELYIGAPPTASISNDGVPILCTSGFVEYEITPGAQNGPGTLYTIEVSDGSDPVVFNHPPPATYTHYYSSVSCGQNDVVFNDTPYPNSFEISITAENACGQSTNGFAPIYIESGPEAQFEFVPNPTNNTICQDVTLTVNDTTTPGSNITSGECDDSYKRFWQIEAPNGSILTSGSNGSIDPNPYATVIGNMGFVPTGIDPNAESASSWFASASTSIDITFLQPGNYEVTLFAGSAGQSNRCGISSYTEVICVTPEVIADFELSTYSVCGPQNVLTTNNSSQTACDNSNIYQWDVSFENPENCPLTSSPNWEFLSGNASSFQPEFQFNTPGVYEITLTVSLDTASGETVCEPDSITKTLIIKDKPQTILPAVELCEQENFTFDLELFDCYADQETSFSWDFQGSEDLVINDTNLLNPTISFSEPGIYPYSLTLTNECGANILSSSIEVYSQVLVTASGPSSVCVNSEISLNGTINGGATTGSWSSSIPGGSFSPSANDLSAIYTPPTDYVGSVILTLTSEDPFGPCPSVSEVVEVDVQLQATSDAGVYDPFCINIPIQLAGILGGAASSGTWSADVPGTFSDETDLNATFTPTTDFTGNITFTLTTDDPPGPCSNNFDLATVEVIPIGQVNPLNDVIFCNNENTNIILFSTSEPGTTFSWTNDNIAIGLAASGVDEIPSFTANNLETFPITATITVTPTITSGSTSCDGIPETFTITINPSAQVDDPVDLVLCHEEVQSEIIFSTQNTGGSTTYDWSIDTGVGLSPTTGTGNIPSFTAVNTGTSPIIATVTVTPTFSNGGVDCDGTPETFTITVNPRPIMDAVDSQTICGGTAFETPIYNSNISDVSYSWELISTNIPSEISGFPTPNGSGELLGNVIQNSGNVSITLDYNLTVSYAGCVGNTVPFSLTVNPSPIVTISPPESQSLCLNGNFESLVVDYNYVGNFDAVSYQWYYNTQDSTDLTGATLISGATTSSFTPPSDTIGTFYYFCVLAFSPPICENATTPTVQITVENPPSISANPEPTQSICVGGIIAENSISVSYNGGSGTPEYQWYVNTVNSYGGTAISDSNSPILDPGIFDTSGSYYYWVSISFPSGDGCGGIFSDLAEVVVVSDPIITDPLPTQIICKNTIPQNLIGSASEGTGDYSYQWYESPSDLPIAGATNSIFTPPTDVVGTFSYYYIVTTEASGCESISALAEVIVNETPTINLQPLAEQSVCLDGAITSLEVEYANGVGTPNYQWYSSSSCDTTDLSNPIANATASSFTPPSDAVGSINYFVVLSFQDGGCGEIISDCASVSVVQNPEITVTSNNPTPICVGGTIDDIEVETSGGVGTATYQWWISDVAGIPISQDINSSNAPSFNPGVFDNVGTFYYVAIVDFDGSGCNQAISSTITVEVVDNPVIETLIPTQVICEGTSPTALEANVSGGTGAYSYQWYESPSNLPISGATNTIFTPPTDVVGLFNYYVVVTTDASGCEATSTMSEVIVNEAPTVSVQPLPEQTVCLDGATTILEVDYSNGVGAPTYQWYSSLSCDTTDLSNPITGATFSSYTPPSDAVGSINYFVVLNFSDGGCGSIISQCAQVNVGEIPSIGDVSTTICSNEAFVVSPTEGGGLNSDDIVPLPMQYSWITTGNSNLTGWSNNSNQAEISQTLVNTTNVPQQIVYTITPTSQTIGNCTGETFDVTVTVNPTPAVSDKLISTCSSELIEFSPSGDGTGSSDIVPENTTYTWTFVDNPNVMGETLNTSGLNQFSQTLTNLNHTQQSVVYQLTPVSSLGCQGETFSITVNLDPVPFISDKSEEICSGEFFEIEPQNNLPNEIVPENTLYTWTTLGNSNLTGWSDESNAQTPITQALVNTTSEPQSINYSVTPQSGSCVGSTFNIVVNVLPNPQVDNATPSTQEICSGEASASVVFSSSVVGTGFEYTLVNTNIPNEISGFETNISGTGDLPQMTLINGLAEPYILDYEVVPTAEGCGGDPVSFSITINPSPQVVFDQQDQVLCNNDSSAVVSLNSTTSDVNFQWTRNTPVGLVGFETGDEQGDGIIPSFNLENTTNAPIDLVFTAIATTTGDAECPGPDAIYTITINPTAQINPIDDQIICSQSTFEDIFVTSPTQSNTSISYEWQVTSAGSNLSGYTAAGGPISISDPIVGEAIFNASNVAEELVYTITPYFDNCPGDPYVFTTVVNPTPEISNTQATICSEETFNILPENGLPTASTIVPENTTFTWVVQNNPNVIGQSNETVEQNSISQTLINLTNTPQNVIYNVTPTSVSGCEGASFELMVTVDPKPVIENKTIELCSGNSFVVEPIDDSPNEIVPSNTLYTWTVLAGADLADLSGFSNQTSPVSIMTQTLVNLTDQIKTIVYEVIPISDSCPGLPFQVEVTVGPSPFVNDIVLEPICSEDSIVVEPQTGFPDSNNIIPAGTTFTWTVVDNPNVIGEFNELTPQNQISQTLQNMSSVTQTLVYNVVPSSSGCDGSPFTVEVSVKPRPFIETGPEIQQTQCSTDQFVIAPEDGVPTASTIIPFGTQYTWVVSEPNSDLIGWSDQSTPVDVIAQTLENTTNQVQQITYTVTPEADGCIGPSFDVVISIEPKPFIPDVLTDICDNTAYTLVPQNGLEPDLNTIVPEVTRYSWSSPTLTSGLSGGSIGTDEVTFNSGVLENQTTSIQTAIYSVTPNYYLASDPTTIQCAGEPFNVTINVSPSPEINEVITNVTCSYSQPLCVGSIEISPVGMAPFSYSWVSLEGNPIANSSAEDLYGLCPGIYELTITDASNCSYVYQYEISPPEPVDFTLISLTDISCNNVNSQPCDGSIELSTTGGTAPYSLVEWYTETTPGSGVFDFGPLINVDNPTRLINACQGNYILKVLDANGCEFVSPIYTVNQTVDAIVISDSFSSFNGFNIDCFGANSGSITADISGGSGVFD
ncbi:MAG: PKD-like domain-containing protein, partial [Flavobacteriaceae bacterium]